MKILPRLILAAAIVCAATAVHAQRLSRPGDLRIASSLRVGDMAPDFKLKMNDGSRDVQLSSFRGKRPVILVFGSYT